VSLDPIHVWFDVDEATVLRAMRLLRKEKGGNGRLAIEVGLADEFDYPRRAAVDFVDVRLDPKAGTLAVRGVMPNRDRMLLPGMSARVRLTLGPPTKVLLVPDGALHRDGAKRFVLVANEKGVLERRDVTVSGPAEGMLALSEGLKADEWVVIEGAKGLKPGDKVEVRKAEPPDGPKD
jgi:gold/copper resistance efflux system membrane fusion protein